jgi:hypothetical protein
MVAMTRRGDPSITLSLIAVTLGIIVGLTTNMLVTDKHQLLAVISGALVAALGLSFSVLYRQHRIGEQLGQFQDDLNRRMSTTEKVTELHAGMVDAHYPALLEIARSAAHAQALVQRRDRCASFIEWKQQSLYGTFIPQLQELRNGRIVINDTHHELTTNRDFLLHLPLRRVRAVSYQDQGFWDEPEGSDFLDAHSEAISKGIEIQRIFIVETQEIPLLQPVVEAQLGLGVSVRILEADKTAPNDREDFVLYDSEYVRSARLKEVTDTNTLKHATLWYDGDVVRRYDGRYAGLLARSIDAVAFYRRHGTELRLPLQSQPRRLASGAER